MSDGTVCILESSSGFDATLSLLLVALRLWPSFACVDGRSEDGSVEGNRIRSGQFFDGRGLFRTGSRELLFLLFFGCSSADFLSIFSTSTATCRFCDPLCTFLETGAVACSLCTRPKSCGAGRRFCWPAVRRLSILRATAALFRLAMQEQLQLLSFERPLCSGREAPSPLPHLRILASALRSHGCDADDGND